MAFILDDIVKGIGAKKAAKEATRAAEEQSKANYESSLANENNMEDSRLTRTKGISQQLTGNRALSPEVLAEFLKRRAQVTRKGAVQDQSKGAMWNAAGNALGSAGNMATQLLGGLGVQKILGGGGGAAPTSLLPQSGSGVSMGGKIFDFAPKKDLY